MSPESNIRSLAHALIEEHSSQAGHWSSPDTELMIRGLCDFGEEPLDALKRLASINNQKKSCNHG